MKKEIADQWVRALRSGKYRQAVGRLHRTGAEDSYCCLGVLCDIAAQDGVVEPVYPDYSDVLPVSYNEETGVLPIAVRLWSGVKIAQGILGNGLALTSLNDELDYSFSAIADAIEANWESL